MIPHRLRTTISAVAFVVIANQAFAQEVTAYLKRNRYDLTSNGFAFPGKDFKILGFGAYHGSAKTYQAEYALLSALTQTRRIKYYIPEANFSQAYFFNQFLTSGDTALLRDLTLAFQSIVMQEGTIETYEHWRKIKEMNDRLPAPAKITVIGIDRINEYKFPIKHLLLLMKPDAEQPDIVGKMSSLIAADTSNFRTSRKGYVTALIKSFIGDVHDRQAAYQGIIADTAAFHHLIRNLEYVLSGTIDREQIIYNNYTRLMTKYRFDELPQFAKYGFSHLLKDREGNFASFFTRLIENKIYPADDVITVLGYLTKSEVLWEKRFDTEGNYLGYKTEAGYGIGDYWKEYFKGIGHLKSTSLSDITLFKLDSPGTPYQRRYDLIRVKLFMKKTNKKEFKNKVTANFIDYAVLIRNSPAQRPIEEVYRTK